MGIEGQPARAEVLRRLTQLQAAGNILYDQTFLLTDAANTTDQQQVLYDRSWADSVQSAVAGVVIVDPEDKYADTSTVPGGIWIQRTITDTSNANAAAQNPEKVRRQIPMTISTGQYASSTTLASATSNRVLGKVEGLNTNTSGVGDVEVRIVLWK